MSFLSYIVRTNRERRERDIAIPQVFSKNEVIKQAPERSLFSLIEDTLRKSSFTRPIVEGLFGIPEHERRAFQPEDAGFLTEAKNRGLLGFFYQGFLKSEKQQVEDRFNNLVRDAGTNPQRATKIAIQDVLGKKKRLSFGEKENVKILDRIEPTEKEKDVLRKAKFFEKGEQALELLDVGTLGITGFLRKGIQGFSRKFLKEVAETSSEKVLKNLLVKELPKAPESLIDDLVKTTKGLKTEKEVAEAVSRRFSQTSRIARTARKVVETQKALPEELSPLVRTAEKFETVDEFIAEIKTVSRPSTDVSLRGVQKLTKSQEELRKLITTTPGETTPVMKKFSEFAKGRKTEEALADLFEQVKRLKKEPPVLAKELEPLAREARKFKTPEEFEKAINKPFVSPIGVRVKDSVLLKARKAEQEELRKLFKETFLEKPSKITNRDIQVEARRIYDEAKRGGFSWARKPFESKTVQNKVQQEAVENLVAKQPPGINQQKLTDFFNKAKETKKTPPTKVRAVPGKPISPTPSKKSRLADHRKRIRKTVGQELPKQNRLRAKVIREVQDSEILSSLFSSKHKKKVPSIAREYAKFRKAQEGIRGRWLAIREKFQDGFIRARKLQQRVTKGKEIPDDINIDQARTLFDGRVHVRLEGIRDVVSDIDKQIIKRAKEVNIPNEKLSKEVDDFLHSRHALERNARLGDGAAGMTTAQANKNLALIGKSPHNKEILEIAEQISELNRKSLKILLDAEVIDREFFDLLNKTYKNHVPLNRIMEETADVVNVLSGRGLDVRSTGIKRAKGSERPVAEIFTNVVINAEQAIIRAEKNLVDLTTLRFARKHNELGLFEEIKAKAIGKAFVKEGEKGRMVFEQITDPLVLTLRERGKPVHLKINDQKLAVAFKGVNVEHIPSLMKGISTITRLFAGLHTRFNYEFAFSNNVRDIQEMMVYVASRKEMGFGSAGRAVKKDLTSKKGVFDFIMGKDTDGARLYKQMRSDGGTTGGLGLSTREQVKLDIEQIRKLNRSNKRKAAEKAIRAVDNWNTIFEDATRLSVYRTALDNGLSRKQAAAFAKESTINFNKKGTAGPIINGLYMFSNASIQGSTKMLTAMKNPKVAGAVVGTMGTAIYAANEWNDNVDPEWRDKVTKWDRSSNLVIMLPTEDESASYITVPISWGLKPIKVSLEYLYDASTGHGNLASAMQGITTSIMEAYNPLAGDESILNTITPTILKVPFEISNNRAWYGSAIKPDPDYSDVPESAKYFKSLGNTLTGKVAIKGTEAVSEASGGAIEISPADVNYAFNQYTGGLGRSIIRIISALTSIGEGELEARERPILNRFLKNRDEERVLQSLYYSGIERESERAGKEKNMAVRRMTPVYEEAQMLVREGKEKEAQKIVDNLTDYDWDIYKKMKASDKRKGTTAEQIAMVTTVRKVRNLFVDGKEDEAQKVVDGLSDEEWETYQKVKDKFGYGDFKSAEETKPDNIKNLDFGESTEESPDGILDMLQEYFKAFGTGDWITVFKVMFNDETLRKTENDTIIVTRFGFEESQETRKELDAGSGVELDHIVPLQLGGFNNRDNLELVDIKTHDSYTRVGNKIGRALRNRRITGKQARKLYADFRNGKITEEQVDQKLKKL